MAGKAKTITGEELKEETGKFFKNFFPVNALYIQNGDITFKNDKILWTRGLLVPYVLNLPIRTIKVKKF